MQDPVQINPDLTAEQKNVLLEAGTEAPFSGALLNNHADGTYTCGNCGAELFSSSTKFDSGSGWPSFYDVIHSNAVDTFEDHTHGMERVEVRCKNCRAHLGHVFPDAFDQPTGQRYCINSAALNFKDSTPDVSAQK